MHALADFIKRQPVIFISLLLIVIVASYYRLWNLNETFHFMGDQGRDALIVSRIFTEKDPVFIGPAMSVGNIYLGPFYYYFMLPFLFLTYPSPVGPVYAVALANILAVLLIFILGRKMVGDRAALFAAGMMAVSEIAILHSRFSWNPNITPLFAILLVSSVYFAVTKSPKYWIGVAACVGLIIQLHYVTLLSGAAAGLIYLWELFRHRTKRKAVTSLVISGLIGFVVFGLLLSPLILFDMRYDWLNFKALQSLASDEKNFVQADETLSTKLQTVSGNLVTRSSLIMFDKVIGPHDSVNVLLVVLVLVVSIISLVLARKKKESIAGIAILIVFLIVGIIGFSLYEKDMYDHYIAYLLPVTFLVTGFCLDRIIKFNMLGWVVALIFLAAVAQYNIPRIEFKSGGPTQAELRDAAEAIHARVSENEPYAIVLLTEAKDSYGMNYRYILNTDQSKKPLDPERNGEAQKLFIINEEAATDRPQDSEIYEVITFGETEPVEVFTLPQGIKVTLLVKSRTSTR